MSEWKECKLGDVAYIVKNTYQPKLGDNLPYVGLEHIQEEGLRLLGIGNSDSITSQKFYFKQNDILFGKLRPYFRKVVKPNFAGVCSTDIWVVRAFKNSDQNFIFYLFASQEFVDTANYGASGTRMPRADWNFIKNSTWKIPPLSEQKAIASVLSSLDNKIDLLHRQNETLESMAETLLRQWFVEEAEEDWEEKSLLKIIKLVGGGTPKTSIQEYWDGNIPWLSGGDIASNHKSFITSSKKTITELGLNKSSAKVLPQYATVISARGTVGKYCILSKPMAYSQSNYGILPEYDSCFFFTYLLINHVVAELQSSAYGSVFDTITTNTFKDNIISIPSKNEIIEFEKKVHFYFQKKLNNQSQICILEKLRNTLLTKLMNGEVRVEF